MSVLHLLSVLTAITLSSISPLGVLNSLCKDVVIMKSKKGTLYMDMWMFMMCVCGRESERKKGREREGGSVGSM